MTRKANVVSLAAIPLALLIACPAGAMEIEDRRSYPARHDEGAASTLHIIGTTEAEVMDDLIRGYQVFSPKVAVVYDQATSRVVYDAVEQDATVDESPYDLAISSAMDLQIKLVNDGRARRHISTATSRLPRWATWRDRIFGFTQEPAVMIYNRQAFAGTAVPQSRFELLNLLRRAPELFKGRIATYDPNVSGLGFLFATQDSLQSDTYWRLMEIFGNLSAQLSCCSSEMLDRVAEGEIALAYNVLGSYAQARRDAGAPIGIVLPRDYTLLMVRTALIPAPSDNAGAAGDFIDFLVSEDGQRLIANEAILSPALPEGDDGNLIPIRLGPGLLVYLDALKRKAFLSEWASAVEERR
ncbi:ABC transporter substrate-binding protein [Pelagibius sp. CAU 1746]|uniref:ABC transporter substrate-binding protein n=1 Tax=Pelagibius sp. CAU 1746 TaxID=3140370 RepID=UPI00325AE47A